MWIQILYGSNGILEFEAKIFLISFNMQMNNEIIIIDLVFKPHKYIIH